MKAPYLFFLSIMPCIAHIGETLQQSALRYGSPIKILEEAPNCESAFYTKEGIRIRAEFLRGKCVGLHFDRDLSFSNAEARAIVVQDGKGWGEADDFISGGHPKTGWTREDKTVATFDQLTGELSILSPSWDEWAYLTSIKQKADEQAAAAKSVPSL